MPKIVSYERQEAAAGPVALEKATAEGMGGNIAAQMQGFGKALEGNADLIQKRQEQADISDLNVKMSQAHAEWTKSYNEQLQNGTLNTEQFTKDFSDYMDSIGEGVQTNKGSQYFKSASAELKGHFLINAAEGQAELAGAKAKNDYMQTLNNGSSALLNDPSSFPLALKMQTAGLDNLVATGGMPAKAAEELKGHTSKELAKSSVRGWIKLSPESAKEQLNSGQWDQYFDGDTKNQLFGEADQASRARSIDDERLKKQQREALEKAQVTTQNQFLQKMSTDELTTKDILNSNLDPFGSGSKEQFLNLMKTQAREKSEKIRTDPNTMIDLYDRVHLPDGDPNKLNDENELNKYFGKGLTMADINTLRSEIQNKKTIAGANEAELKKGVTDIAKGKLTKSNPLTGVRDPLGDEQYQKFLVSFMNDYSTQIKKGKTPQQLLSPDSPDYLGKSISQYTRSSKQIIQDMVKMNAGPAKNGLASPTPAPTPTVEPRKAGESAAQYLKRIGK